MSIRSYNAVGGVLRRRLDQLTDGVSALWTPDQLVSGYVERPVGTGYLRYEDIPGYNSADTFQVNMNRTVNLSSPQYITLPEGDLTFSDFSVNYHGMAFGANGLTNVQGLIGSGRGTRLMMVAGTSTHAGDVPTNVSGSSATNPTGLISFTSIANCLFQNLSVIGTDQGHLYNGVGFVQCNNALISGVYLRGASPGNWNSPPGETFGINVYRSNDVTIQDSEVDGRDSSGNPVGASPIGWNGQGPTTNPTPALNAKIYRTYVHDGLTGMPTFWLTSNIYTEDLWSQRTATGTGNLSGSSINHEMSTGPIHHVRPNLQARYHIPTPQNSTGNSGMHFAFAHVYQDLPDVLITDPTFDAGFSSSGAMAMAIYKGYTLNGATNMITTFPTVIKNGVTLNPYPNDVTNWGNGLTAANGYSIAR